MKTSMKKILSLCLTLLLLTVALPIHAGMAEEIILDNEIAFFEEEETGEAEQPGETPQEESVNTEQPEPAVADVPEVQAPQASAGGNDDAIAQFFGIKSIEGYEAFYQALYSYSMMRGVGGMPMTIQVPDSGLITFNGAKHQAVSTSGSVTTSVPIPPYYTVTFEAKTEGRIPGTYSPTLSNMRVWDSLNGMDMTGFFDIKVVGGSMEISATGSLLMIKADDWEREFDGYIHSPVVTTGQAVINWMPMSPELRLTLRATGWDLAEPYSWEMSLESYAIEVIEDGTDITGYFEYVFASAGKETVTPPSEKILVVVQPPDVVWEYGWFSDVDAPVISIDGKPPRADLIYSSASLNPQVHEMTSVPGVYNLTQEDWIASYGWAQHFDIIILPSTLTILPQ